MLVIINTLSTNEHDNGDCDYAVVEIDSQYLDRLRRMRETAARVAQEWNGTLCCLQFYDDEATFYAAADLSDLLDEAVQRNLDHDGYALLPGDLSLASVEPQRTEGQCVVAQVHSGECDFCWSCYPKYTESIEIESTVAPLTWIEEAAASSG